VDKSHHSFAAPASELYQAGTSPQKDAQPVPQTPEMAYVPLAQKVCDNIEGDGTRKVAAPQAEAVTHVLRQQDVLPAPR
jgi:hypothetical protein